MREKNKNGSNRTEREAHFRFSVIGHLLAAPPARGELRSALQRLSQKTWQHPQTQKPMTLSAATIERWLYLAKNAGQNPVRSLRRKIRSDCGQQTQLSEKLCHAIIAQYKAHRSWSYQLHFDNLNVWVEAHPELGHLPSYSTVRRFMKTRGLCPTRRRGPLGSVSGAQTQLRFEEREVRSFESPYVHGLWHLDFHHARRQIILPDGKYVTPILLGILDDHSRLACHVQWYLSETAEDLVHGLTQAIQKRDMPRALMTDNGSAMISSEVEQGLKRLSILHETTLPYSPEQNAKQEVYWAQVEGRLMPMLEGEMDLTLPLLNKATLAWMELEYNRSFHRELGKSPLDTMLEGPSVGRESPSADELRFAFTLLESRRQRRSDGTISLQGIRFEIPGRYRQLDDIHIRYSSWDLSHVWLYDPRNDVALCRIFPLDKTKNADGHRRLLPLQPVQSVPPTEPIPPSGMAPLLKKIIADYEGTGLPPAYIPKAEYHSEPQTETPLSVTAFNDSTSNSAASNSSHTEENMQ